MKAIFLKELRSYFRNPIGYVFIGMMLLIMGIYYTYYTIIYQYADYYHILEACTMLVLFVMPILTMRIFSEEKKNKTDQLLLTAPVKTTDIVIGKFLAAFCIYLLSVVLSLVQPLTTVLIFKGEMTSGMTGGGYAAYIMLSMAFIAIGMFISALTENQLIAAVITIGLFVVLMLTDGIYSMMPTSRYVSLGFLVLLAAGVAVIVYFAIKDLMISLIVGIAGGALSLVAFLFAPKSFDGLMGRIFQSLSIFERYDDMFSGSFALGHIVFFLSLTVFFLFLTVKAIEKKRWS